MPDTPISPAPLLSPLRNSGGTYYTFSSANNDNNRSTMESAIRIAPSKFACLRLPAWANMSGVQHMFKDPTDFGNPLTPDPNVLVPKMMQNYLENCLQYSYQYRTDNTLKAPTEAFFWKMLRDMGAMSLKETKTVILDGEPFPVFIEDVDSVPGYEPIVQYVGDVNVVNHIKKEGQVYTEVYCHVPTQSGKLNEPTFVNNQIPFKLAAIPDGGGGEFVVGLEDYINENNKAIYDTTDRKYEVLDDINSSTLYFNDFDNDETKINQGNFEFNAVLLWYDVWNGKDTTTKARNLHGILFLDRYHSAVGGGEELKMFTKYMPDAETAGNSYGFCINLKFSNSSNQTTSETTINDYDTMSMMLYMEALQRINNITQLYNTYNNTIMKLVDDVAWLKSMMTTLPGIREYTDRLETLEQYTYAGTKTERISYEEMFQLLFDANAALANTTVPVNIQQIIGRIQFDATGMPIVSAPDGSVWKWDPITSTWING